MANDTQQRQSGQSDPSSAQIATDNAIAIAGLEAQQLQLPTYYISE